MIEILNIEDLELNVSLQCRRVCVWWGAWKFHLDQCSVMAAWASLSLTTHKYQQPGTPRHTDTGAATSRHSFYLNTPFSAHDFPAPCPVLPIFCRFQVWTSLKIFRLPSLRWASGAARDTTAGHIHYPHDVAASSCETRGDTRRHGPRGN